MFLIFLVTYNMLCYINRIRGLIRSGALKEIDRPVWYDVYEAFPPKQEPVLNRNVQTKEPVPILYMDDFIRS